MKNLYAFKFYKKFLKKFRIFYFMYLSDQFIMFFYKICHQKLKSSHTPPHPYKIAGISLNSYTGNIIYKSLFLVTFIDTKVYRLQIKEQQYIKKETTLLNILTESYIPFLRIWKTCKT